MSESRCAYCHQSGWHKPECSNPYKYDSQRPRREAVVIAKQPSEGRDVDEQDADDDPVDHPAHYTHGGVECIDAIAAALGREAYRGFLQGNAIKYLWRYKHKGTPATCLRKAKWYLDRLIADIVEENTGG